MEKLKLHIKSDQPIILEIPNPSDDLKKHVVDQVLKMSRPSIIFSEPIHPETLYAEQEAMIVAEPPVIEPVDPNVLARLTTLNNRPISIKDENAAKVAALDKKKEEEAIPDFYLTGIKVDPDGTKRYKCRYKCSNNSCRQEANHYVPENTAKVNCHNCGQELKVQKSMPAGEEIEKDPFGNFYVAGARKPYYESGFLPNVK